MTSRVILTLMVLVLVGCAIPKKAPARQGPLTPRWPRPRRRMSQHGVEYAARLQEIEACYLSSEFTSASLQQAAEALNGITPPKGFELRHRELISEILEASRLEYGVRQGGAVGAAGGHLDNLAREADPATQNPTPLRCAGLTPPVTRRR